MPAKNIVKSFTSNIYYHVYNRGVEKRPIFMNDLDYKVFLSYLKLYLSSLQGPTSQKRSPSKKLKNFNDTVDLIAYILMPNHFHFLFYQHTDSGISNLMQCLMTKYVKQFNYRYSRVGPLFQSKYKAVQIKSESQLLYCTKYIHRNCLDLQEFGKSNIMIDDYQYSSYQNYIGKIYQPWIKPESILSYFSKQNFTNSYPAFVKENSLMHESVTDWGIDLA